MWDFICFMKYLLKIHLLLVALLLTTDFNCHAQISKGVEKKVNEIVQKYEDRPGVSCMTVVKGGGLEMVKMMLNKELGKDLVYSSRIRCQQRKAVC